MKMLLLAVMSVGVFSFQMFADSPSVEVVHETPSLSDEQLTQLPVTTIRLHGTDGLRFTGRITADGRSFTISSQLPSEFVIPGELVECDFYKIEPAGILALRLMSEDGNSFQETHTERPTGGVRGRIKVSNVSTDLFGGHIESSSRESTVTVFEK